MHWCDGSQAEIDRLCAEMVDDGTLIPLDPVKHPGCFYARSHVNDVARVEDRTFICCPDKSDAGPTNNWSDPAAMHVTLDRILSGCMQGRTMYVLPYLMGPPKSPMARVGIEITDSPYVVANMRIMTRMGQIALDELGDRDDFVKGIHSVVTLNPADRYISHFPAENLVISVNSNYGGNALLGKKCFALRLASVIARDEGWLAEHMLIIGITDPSGRKTLHRRPRFRRPAAKQIWRCSFRPRKTSRPGWKVETIGDDIAWLKFGADGRLHGVNPEYGFFGVAPGTSLATNPNAMLSCQANTIFTNVALLERSQRLVGRDGRPAADAGLRLAGQSVDAAIADAGRPSQQPLHGPRVAVPVDLARLGEAGGRADSRDSVRRPAHDDDSPRLSGLSLATRNVRRRVDDERKNSRRRRQSRRAAPRSDGHAPLLRLSHGRLLAALDRDGRARRRSHAVDLPRQLVPQRCQRQVALARLPPEHAGAQVDGGPRSRRGRRGKDGRSAWCRARTISA